MAIASFADKATELFWYEERVGKGVGWAGCSRPALRKLTMLDTAEKLSDLNSPPGNFLEALRGDLEGFHSIRVNDQWRLVFKWTDQGPTDVRIADYH